MDFLHNMEWVLPYRSDTATVVANAFTWLGYGTFFLIALPLIYWLWDRAIAIRLVVLIAITAAINSWLKDYWQDPRPPRELWLDQRVKDSYGRPSGHAQVAFAMWIWIAYEIKKSWAWALAIFIVAGVCASRLYLAVHDIDDILTGLSLGVVGMFLFIWLQTSTFAAIRNLPVVAHLAIVVASGFLLFVTWPNGENPSPVIGLLALLFGWLAGADVDHRLAPAKPVLPGLIGKAIMAIGGIVVLFALQIGLKKVIHLAGVEGTVASYATSVFLGFYMTCLAPMAFRAVKLVK
ncbi:MAG: phosphatase PAP2 family protein [Parvibaculaceae bacterium]